MNQAPFRVCVLLIALGSWPLPATAQDDPRFALLTSFPNPTVSFQRELADRFAIRIEVSYTFRDETTNRPLGSSSLSIGGFTQTSSRERHTETTSHTTSIAVAPIFTMYRTDRIGLYLAPRLALTLTRDRIRQTDTATITTSGVPTGVIITVGDGTPLDPDTRTANMNYSSPSGALSLGAVTNLHPRLALFGEAGLGYARSNTPLSASVLVLGVIDDSEVRRSTINSRATAGMMIRF
jgi:hypothetical protein